MAHQDTGSSTRAVPAPPPADAAEGRAGWLTDVADRLQEAGDAPLEERAAALAAIHETLVSELREAEG